MLNMPTYFAPLAAFLIGICFELIQATPARAQDTKCSVRDQNNMVAVVICPPGLDQTGWRDAGVKACGTRKPCGAWIWDDPAKAPKKAPPAHDKLEKEQITSAVAIWINEQSKLVTISAEKK